MLGLCCSLLAVGGHASTATPAERERMAEQAFRRGDLPRAGELWQSLARSAASDPETRWRALLRLGEVQRQLGSARDAESTLAAALELAEGLDGPAAVAASRGALAAARAALGETEVARGELREAVAEARQARANDVLAAILNELGNLEAEGGPVEAALAAYGEAVNAAEVGGDVSLAFRVAVNRAALAAGASAPDAARRWLGDAQRRGLALPASHGHAYDRVRLARAAIELAARSPEQRDALRSLARAELQGARETADLLGDAAARSWALGTLAGLDAAEGRDDEALVLTRSALRDAQRADLREARLRWHAQAAFLLRRRGDLDAAIAAYGRAAELLEELRSARAGSGRQWSPGALALPEVHVALADLLLRRAASASDADRAEQDLRAAQRTMERFKADELRDYFRDDCVDAYREKVTDPARASRSAAVIYPIALPDRLELLVSSASGIRRFATPVGAEAVDAEARSLRRLLTKLTTRQYLNPARRLYDWLVRPLQEYLDALGVDTLVFVPGGVLRTIPMAALHDGEHFLIERYAVAVTPGLELTDPGPIDRADLVPFLGGLSESREGFPPLPHVVAELETLHELHGGRLLLNESFSRENIEHTLRSREFSIVHIATHAEFGADPESTFLLAYDGRLTVGELAEDVGAFRYRETPLDLILLSACDTAAGDERAALGLAGVAVRAGARSAVGTLWPVADEATSQLVLDFYAELSRPGVSRAQALQHAQLSLLHTWAYQHPRFWSPFLLISNWL